MFSRRIMKTAVALHHRNRLAVITAASSAAFLARFPNLILQQQPHKYLSDKAAVNNDKAT